MGRQRQEVRGVVRPLVVHVVLQLIDLLGQSEWGSGRGLVEGSFPTPAPPPSSGNETEGGRQIGRVV